MSPIFKNITLGSDPEFFIVTMEDGEPVSSIGIIDGVKGKATPIPELGNGFGLQIDNVLGEFNIPVCHTPYEVVTHISNMIEYLYTFLEPKGLEPSFGASMIYPQHELESDEAKQFGCSPDFNAWFDGMINVPPTAENLQLRSAGCHFHVGFDEVSDDDAMNLIKALDLFLGVPFVIIDNDTRRRELYGKAGCFRFTSFGVEYRVLSGMLLSNRILLEFATNQIMKAIGYLNLNGISKIQEDKNLIISCINNGDTDIARELIQKHKIRIPDEIREQYFYYNEKKKALFDKNAPINLARNPGRKHEIFAEAEEVLNFHQRWNVAMPNDLAAVNLQNRVVNIQDALNLIDAEEKKEGAGAVDINEVI